MGLELQRDDKPKRHAEIVGWPGEKHKQKMLAMNLAAKSDLILNS